MRTNFSVDPIEIMCKRENYKHLSDEEFLEVKSLLIEFKDLFLVSNITIGRANNSEFHMFIRFLLLYAECPFTRNP